MSRNYKKRAEKETNRANKHCPYLRLVNMDSVRRAQDVVASPNEGNGMTCLLEWEPRHTHLTIPYLVFQRQVVVALCEET